MPKKPARKRKSPSSRKARPARATRKKKRSVKKRNLPAGWRRYLRWRVLLLASFVFSLAWVVYLDVVIRTQFEGKRWALPAQVYGRPLELYAGRVLSAQSYRQELEQLGYRYSYRVDEPGTFSQQDRQFRVYRRPFRFWDSEVEARLLDVKFDSGRISDIRDTQADTELDVVRMEPPRVGGIYPAHHEDRVLIKLEQAPALLRQGLVAVEDHNYYEHYGVNPRAIARALWANIRSGRTVQGGSTLTQQLVKNFFLSNKRNLWRKGNEAVMALLLEWHYGKDEILEAYLNEIYLGQGHDRAVHGFGLASHFYFDRQVENLDLAQVATLIALVRGPSYYDPRRHPVRLKARRDLVLKIMVKRGVISESQARQVRARDLGVVQGQRAAPRYPAFMDLIRRQLQRDYRKQDLTTEGLRIFTSFDPRIQQQAEHALQQRVKQLDRQQGLHGQLQGAVIVTDTTSAEVLAVVGDRKLRFAGFNRALDAVRPIGSLIKPPVYLSALEQSDRYTLSTPLDDAPIHLKTPQGGVWSPRNYDKKSHGTVPLFQALVHSYNQASVRLGMDVGFERIADTLARLGAKRKIPPYPSMLLGAVDFSPYEVAGMYQTLAAGGFRSPLRAIREVTTSEGEPLRRFPIQVEQTVDPTVVAVLVSAMHEVTRTGTARSLQQRLPSGLTVAGKTGTTNDLRDSWFAGFSGEHLAVVWLGRDDNQTTGLTGSSGALRVWADIMAVIPTRPLQPPVTDAVGYEWIDGKTGLLSAEGCQGAVQLAFVEGTAPQDRSGCASKEEASGSSWFDRLFN